MCYNDSGGERLPRFPDRSCSMQRYLVETLIHLNMDILVYAESEEEAFATAKVFGETLFPTAALVDPVDLKEA